MSEQATEQAMYSIGLLKPQEVSWRGPLRAALQELWIKAWRDGYSKGCHDAHAQRNEAEDARRGQMKQVLND